MATANSQEQKPDVEDNKQDEVPSSNDSNSNPNAFLNPLKKLLDTRATNLLINILSKIIQDPTDKRRQLTL